MQTCEEALVYTIYPNVPDACVPRVRRAKGREYHLKKRNLNYLL